MKKIELTVTEELYEQCLQNAQQLGLSSVPAYIGYVLQQLMQVDLQESDHTDDEKAKVEKILRDFGYIE